MVKRVIPFVFMASAIALGAMGAHYLKSVLSEKMMTAFQTGVLYQMVHGLGLLALWGLKDKWTNEKSFKTTVLLLSWGTILFSGSIYMLALNEWGNWGMEKIFGPITPIGGVCMIAGWVYAGNHWTKKSKMSLVALLILSSNFSWGQLTVSNITTYKAHLSWPAAPGANGYLILRSQDTITSIPQEAMSYQVGDYIGNAQVAYVGNLLAFDQLTLRASSHYFFQLYSWIGGILGNTYFPDGPQLDFTTPFNMMGTYYDGIDSTALTFVDDLKARIRSPYNKISYNSYDETMINDYAHVDTTGGQQIVNCVYSQFHYLFTPPFGWLPISREHTYCHSWMPSYSSTSTDEYADQHHLFPVQQNNANGVRSNHPLGEVVTPVSTFGLANMGNNDQGYLVYEPREVHKGDAARALLYMSLRYDDVNGLDWSFDYLNNVTLPGLSEGSQSLETLLTWHFQDLPDAYERGRNDYIQSNQLNRNPFVDHPFWVNRINFADMSYIAIPNDIHENETSFNLHVLDNGGIPVVVKNNNALTDFRVLDQAGRVVVQLKISAGVLRFQDLNLSDGLYFVQCSDSKGSKAISVVQHHQN